MVTNVYSVHDDKVGFCPVFMDSNDESAIRGFAYAFRQSSSLMSFAPSDFRLYRVGSFDTQSGILSSECSPVLVSDLVSLVRKENENEE